MSETEVARLRRQQSAYPKRAPETDLTRLRRRQRNAVRQIEKLEATLIEYRAKLADIEARLTILAPELPLEIKRRKRDRIFRPGELPRLAMAVMREEGAPVPNQLVAVRCLAAKGVMLPGPGTMRRTRTRLQQIFLEWEKRGVSYRVGSKRQTLRGLVRAA